MKATEQLEVPSEEPPGAFEAGIDLFRDKTRIRKQIVAERKALAQDFRELIVERQAALVEARKVLGQANQLALVISKS